MTSRFRSLLAVAVVASLALAGCTAQRDQVSPTETGPWPGNDNTSAPSSVRLYDQPLQWVGCGQLECATVQVPLDWDNPDGQTISIAINRYSESDPSVRIGSLLINPGGPGGSGLDLTDYFPTIAGDQLLEHYDIVGFDPRGVGQSTPITCGDGSALDAFLITDYEISTQADMDAARARTATFAQACRAASGAIIENADTVSAARDMDVIRAALGDDKLHYLGFSYGSQLGATYAALYPENVGHMVLDGAVDFLLPPEDLSEGQAEGFEEALDAFIADCLEQRDCPLVGDPLAARKQIASIVDTAREDGYPSGARLDVNGNLIVYGIVVTLYDEETWEYLKAAITEVVDLGTARLFYELANFYLDRNGTTGTYNGNSSIAFQAISCLDEGAFGEWTLEEFREYREYAEEISPTFGWWFASSLGCDGWPWDGQHPVTDLGPAAAAGPILVVGTSGDPATPLEWAESLTDRMPNAALLIYDGEGHTAYGRSNQCITDVVDTYLVEGTLPDSGMRC